MKILILEDNEYRIKKFKTELIGHNVDYTITAALANKLVLCNKYDIIFLDHDLGGEEGVDSNNPNTGYQVAKTIIKSKNKDTFTVVHSCNPAGAQNIQSVIKHSILCPFIILDIRKAIEAYS